MNYEELIESLWKEAEKKIETMIRETDEEESKIEKETLLALGRIRNDGQHYSTSESAKRTEEIVAEAEKDARRISIEANVMLAERLYKISSASLPGLRKQGYEGIFRNLVAELPTLPWKTVRVNPEDSGIAGEHFPGAEIVTNKLITGGLDAVTEVGKVQVINTFDKRLERAWEDIIPDLLKGVYEAA
jgi:V/A-type H+-transporting ATPase subunit E